MQWGTVPDSLVLALRSLIEGDVCENIDTFNFERHDAFAFVVLGIFVLRGSLPYDDDASSSRLLDPQYVQFCVEAALEADGLTCTF